MGIALVMRGSVGGASLYCPDSPGAPTHTAQPDHVGYHPRPELSASARDASCHAAADARAIEVVTYRGVLVDRDISLGFAAD